MKINLLWGFFTKILPCIAMLSACGGARQEGYSEITESATSDSTTAAVVSTVSNAKDFQENLQSIDSEIAEKLSKKKFVYAVSMQAKVKDVEKATTQIWRLANKFEGFITSSLVTTNLISTRFVFLSTDSLTKVSSYAVQNKVVLRVPIEHLDTTLLEISKMYGFLENHQIKAEDVTLTLLDNQLKTRLFTKTSHKIAQATDQKGGNLEEITQAVEENEGRQAQIISQQINKLDLLDKVAFAKIEINFYQEPLTITEVVENPETNRYELSFENQLTDSLKFGWQMLSFLIINLAKIWFMFPIAAGAYWAYRKYIK